MGVIWITRPGEGGERTAAALAAHGYDAVHVPLLELDYASPRPAPGPPWPDWILFVSANAVEGFRRALAGGETVSFPPGVRAAAVGEKTAEAARVAGFRVDLVPDDPRAEGLLAALAGEDLAGARIWIPAGNQEGSATRTLPEEFAARGARVTTLRVYGVEPRPLDGNDLERLGSREPGAVLLHSPSAARAFARALREHSGLSAWARAECIAIGPVTAEEIRRLGLREPRVSTVPSDEGILRIVEGIATLRC